MVDNLRKSVADLQAPICPICSKPMIWTWSQLVEYSPVVIEHEFVCGICGGTSKRQDVRPDQHIQRPGKLSLPKVFKAA